MTRQPAKKELAEEVVAFRLAKTRVKKLRDDVAAHKIVGVGSAHQLCRKVVVDFLDGKLIYLDQRDRYSNPGP